MFRPMMLVIVLLLVVSSAEAATLYLKNGSTVVGTVVARTTDSIKMDVSGVTLTYYSDEVDRIDELSVENPVADTSAESGKLSDPVPVVEAALVPVVTAPPVPVPVESIVPSVSESVTQVTPTVSPVVAESTSASKADVYAGVSKKELILKFIDLFGTRNSMASNFEQMASTMPAEQGELFKKTFKVDEIVEMLVPLYDKHFTESELKELVAFYSTPAGGKLVRSIPLIMNESVDVSTKYFESHMGELTEALKKSGVGTAQPKK